MAQGLRKHRHIVYEADVTKRYDNNRNCIVKLVTYRCYCPNCNYEYVDRSFVNVPEAKSKTSVLERNKKKHSIR